MPHDKVPTILYEALAQTSADANCLVRRLAAIYRNEEEPKSTEQVVALGLLACAKALREASLVEEIAIREEMQDLNGLAREVLAEVRQMEDAIRQQTRERAGRRG